MPASAGPYPVPRGDATLGVVHDVDGVLGIASPRRQLGRVRALLTHRPGDRRSVLGLPHLLRVLAGLEPEPLVYYRASCTATATRRAPR